LNFDVSQKILFGSKTVLSPPKTKYEFCPSWQKHFFSPFKKILSYLLAMDNLPPVSVKTPYCMTEFLPKNKRQNVHGQKVRQNFFTRRKKMFFVKMAKNHIWFSADLKRFWGDKTF